MIKSPEYHHMICNGKTKWASEKGLLLARSVDVCVYMYVVSFRFKAKENLQRCWDVFDILITTKWSFRLSVCFNTFRNLNRSSKKRRMSPAQTITTE